MILISTVFVTRLAEGAYRWPGLDKPKGQYPFLRSLAFLFALTVVLVRDSVEAEDLLLFLWIRRKVGKEKVEERGEDNGFVTVSDEDQGRGLILSIAV